MEAMFKGERIDKYVREAVRRDRRLSHLIETPRGQPGPDFLDPKTGRWYDITTEGQWAQHVRDYAPAYGNRGVGILYKLPE